MKEEFEEKSMRQQMNESKRVAEAIMMKEEEIKHVHDELSVYKQRYMDLETIVTELEIQVADKEKELQLYQSKTMQLQK